MKTGNRKSSIILGLIIFMVVMSGCSHSDKVKDAALSNTPISEYADSETKQWFVMTIEKVVADNKILVQMNQDDNSGKTALGENDFNGYLDLSEASIKDKTGNIKEWDDLKSGQTIMAELSSPSIVTASFPPQIIGSSIYSIVIID